MSVPNIPDICPKIVLDEEDVYNLTLTSIALEEIALSQIIKAESEKLTLFINMSKCNPDYYEQALKINESVEGVLDKVYAIENLLVNKTKLISSMKNEISKKPKEKNEKESKCKTQKVENNKNNYTVECCYNKGYNNANRSINNIFSKFK